jgi:hypothetical protein
MSQLKDNGVIKAFLRDQIAINENVFAVGVVVAKEAISTLEGSSRSVSQNLDQSLVPNELRNSAFGSTWKNRKIQSKLCRGARSRCSANELDEWLTE